MPVAALIDNKIFCCHGGLSPTLRSLDQLKRISRPCDVQETGLLCDILWSDPDSSVVGWAPNERGVSYVFGVDVLAQFLQKMDLDIVVVEDGYEFFGRRGLVTVFSAPNYCGEFDNAGAVMNVDENLLCSFQVRFSHLYEFHHPLRVQVKIKWSTLVSSLRTRRAIVPHSES
ncbi:unnamed protein product [Nippostrongylus brasiliensis]|uniref:SER_THR_PHOSPHATASE domain-containing protein n=1 Tax=Nippostrongylus brasiliensis TaxID=27835 RepID=A0A0N4XQM8_NIPBR|nr:unnamed protein product [Nippostrongylus brasiliensis]